MSKAVSESADSKSKRGLSIRLDPDSLVIYEKCVGDAGLNVTAALRTSVSSMLTTYRALQADGFLVTSSFTRKSQQDVDDFPEFLGSVIFEVTPPAGLTVEDLHRLIFLIPEFVFENGLEPFRIDSAHFHRVASYDREVVSGKVTRNVLSFRLIRGAWRASVFDYHSGRDHTEIEHQIADAVKKNIAATIACAITHQLPETRVLSAEEVAELNATLLPHLFAR